MKNSKQTEYSAMILGKIQELFKDNEELMQELSSGDNATDFIHSLANIVPTHFYCYLTGANVNMLEFNHIANQLVFQNSKSISNEQ